jgi:hypothetical protein
MSTVTESIKSIYKAQFPNAFIDDATALEIQKAIKSVCSDATLDDIRHGVQECRVKSDRPAASWEIAQAIRIQRRDVQHGHVPGNLIYESREHFRKALIGEPDLGVRWSIICDADIDRLPVRFREDNTTEWKRNPNRLYVEKGFDPCVEAQRIADMNGIEYRRFSPPKDETGAYLSPRINAGAQEVVQKVLKHTDTY